jgi:hypothetical protein
MWMFTRHGKYVVKKLPAGAVVGSATTLLDAADVAMEDARKGPGKWVIEQPVIEVDVSKAYGVLALAGDIQPPPDVPDGLTILDVGVTDVSAQCSAVGVATGYQWYLSGAPNQVTAAPSVYISGLVAATGYTVQVAALRGGVSSDVSVAAAFTTGALELPVWKAVPAQDLTVGAAYSLELLGYASSPGGDTPAFAVVSGVLPAGLAIVGTRITGTPTAVETQTPVIRATAAGGSADSAAFVMESLNADATAPAAPTNFAAVGYSSTQVRLTWTNPAGDAVVVGERASGFQRVDVYRDGVKVDQVLATAADPESYLATWNAVALWKVRSVDFVTPNPNKGAFTAELSAGPLAQSTAPGAPVNVVATRTGATTATLTWLEGSGPAPTSYRVYQATALAGPYLLVSTQAGKSYAASGFTGSQTPYFYVIAVANGLDSAASAIVAAQSGTVGTVIDLGFDFGVLTNNITDAAQSTDPQGASTAGWRRLSGPNSFGEYDSFDPASGDVPCELVTSPVRYTNPSGGAGYTSRSLHTLLTFHTGAAAMPSSNTRFYPSATWYHKGGALTNDRTHRNEVRDMGQLTVTTQVDNWIGFSLYVPTDVQPASWMGSQRLPIQLHGPTGGRNPIVILNTTSGWDGLLVVPHPTAAAIVRAYQRGGDLFGTLLQAPIIGSADGIRVEWSAPTSGPTVSAYRMFRSVRPQGTFVQIGTDIPAATTSAQSSVSTGTGGTAGLGRATISGTTVVYYTETGVGTNNAGDWSTAYVYVRPVYVGGSLGPASLICPAPREYLGVSCTGYSFTPGGSDNSQSGVGRSIAKLSDVAGHWSDFVVHYKLSSASGSGAGSPVLANGTIEAFYNEQSTPFLYSSGIRLGEGVAGHYWKAGTYHGRLGTPLTDQDVPPDWPKRWECWIDEVRHTTKSGGLTTQTDSADSAYVAVKPRGVRS